MLPDSDEARERLDRSVAFMVGVFTIYFTSNPGQGDAFDYTLRIASAFLNGHLGTGVKPPAGVGEMVPYEGRYYSVFPLGSVLTMLPLAVLRRFHVILYFPGVALAAISAAVSAFLLSLLARRYESSRARRMVLAVFPVLGTWMWANLGFGGAWQVALGAAVAGQLGALYFTLVRFHPGAAGLCFALAFGNRTEVVLLAPIFYFLIHRKDPPGFVRAALLFSAAPLALGVATLAYNFARFGSAFDFGYARLPRILEEPWYRRGIFSWHAIPLNAREMLLTPWKRLPGFPYVVPTGFGGSIFLSSPYLIFLFGFGARDAALKRLAWVAVFTLTAVLWCHGNPGGWQFSYRYAMVLLPWFFVILQESRPREVTRFEWVLFAASLAINAFATWLFLRTDYMTP